MALIEYEPGNSRRAFESERTFRPRRRPGDQQPEALITHPFRLAVATLLTWAAIVAVAIPFVR